ncbi:6937_t:CDS:2 [Entrophospora sp. SA101]|nr:6937_t:CDS:2 [Entrophospora sp. SA101]
MVVVGSKLLLYLEPGKFLGEFIEELKVDLIWGDLIEDKEVVLTINDSIDNLFQIILTEDNKHMNEITFNNIIEAHKRHQKLHDLYPSDLVILVSLQVRLIPYFQQFLYEDSEECGDADVNDDLLKDTDYTENEFAIEKFKKKILKYIKSHDNIPSYTLEMANSILSCDEIQSNHLLFEGILCCSYLEKEQPKLYKQIETKKNLNYFKLDVERYKAQLSDNQMKLIKDLIIHNTLDYRITSQNQKLDLAIINLVDSFKKIWKLKCYQRSDKYVNEKTFGHNIVDKIIDFIFYDIVAESKWDGCPAQSTKFRNATQNITRYPDFYAYEENYGYFFNHEYLFLEISNGPWATGNDHIKHVNEDRFRLCKFQKDAHKYVYYILKNKNLKHLKSLLDNIVFISIHFYELKMDINIMDCKIKPFYIINPFQQIDLPLRHLDQKESIDSLVSLCQSLLILNNIIKENIINIGKLNQEINATISTPTNQPITTLEPGSGGSIFTTNCTP